MTTVKDTYMLLKAARDALAPHSFSGESPACLVCHGEPGRDVGPKCTASPQYPLYNRIVKEIQDFEEQVHLSKEIIEEVRRKEQDALEASDNPKNLVFCVHGRMHSWSSWWERQDPMNPPEDGFYYHRECQIMGCTVWQRARYLTPVGETLLVEGR